MTAVRADLMSLTVTVLLAAEPLPAQAQVSVSGSATGVVVQPRATILFQGVRERLGGVWFGGAVELERGPVTLSVMGMRGNLEPIDNTAALGRDGGEVSGVIRVSPVRWLGLEGGYTVRAFNSAAGYQQWRVPSAGLVLSGKLGDPGLRAYVRAAYLPSVQVSGIDSPDLGLAAEAGLVVAPSRVPLLFKVQYRVERYDFPGGASSRLEQFDRVALSVGLRLGEQLKEDGGGR